MKPLLVFIFLKLISWIYKPNFSFTFRGWPSALGLIRSWSQIVQFGQYEGFNIKWAHIKRHLASKSVQGREYRCGRGYTIYPGQKRKQLWNVIYFLICFLRWQRNTLCSIRNSSFSFLGVAPGRKHVKQSIFYEKTCMCPREETFFLQWSAVDHWTTMTALSCLLLALSYYCGIHTFLREQFCKNIQTQLRTKGEQYTLMLYNNSLNAT